MSASDWHWRNIMENIEDELLTVEEVAARLKLTPCTVRRLALDGKITRVNVSEKLNRILKSDVDAYISNNRK